MSDSVLTRDNLHLSRPTMVEERTLSAACAINFTSPVPSTVADYIRESLAENTRVAYLNDLRSRPTMVEERTLSAACAINFTSPVPSTVADYIRESLAENTRVAYLNDL